MDAQFVCIGINRMFAPDDAASLWRFCYQHSHGCIGDARMTGDQVEHILCMCQDHCCDVRCGVWNFEKVVTSLNEHIADRVESGMPHGAYIHQWRRLHECSDANGEF
jgi:hypothetical protein